MNYLLIIVKIFRSYSGVLPAIFYAKVYEFICAVVAFVGFTKQCIKPTKASGIPRILCRKKYSRIANIFAQRIIWLCTLGTFSLSLHTKIPSGSQKCCVILLPSKVKFESVGPQYIKTKIGRSC